MLELSNGRYRQRIKPGDAEDESGGKEMQIYCKKSLIDGVRDGIV
jgi:hypothetical protein